MRRVRLEARRCRDAPLYVCRFRVRFLLDLRPPLPHLSGVGETGR
jgi:hypothetical protein